MSGSSKRPVDLRNLITSLITSLFKLSNYFLNHTVNKELSLWYLILKKMDLVCKDKRRVQISGQKSSGNVGENVQWSLHGEKITQVKTLCNVFLETPDNNAEEKFLFNVVLIFLERHCKSKQPVQRKIPIQCCLNSLRTTLRK